MPKVRAASCYLEYCGDGRKYDETDALGATDETDDELAGEIGVLLEAAIPAAG